GNFIQLLVHPRSETAGSHSSRPPVRFTAQTPGTEQFVGYDGFRAQFDDWVTAIEQSKDCVLSGRSVVPVVRLIEACYAQRRDLIEPWTDEGMNTIAAKMPAGTPGTKRKRV